MSIPYIVSFDDLHENNNQWQLFLDLKKKLPALKVTFFVITGKESDEFLNKIKQDWTELVFHSYEHNGEWLKWSKDEAKEWLLYFQKHGFARGFKAPGWKMTQNIADAINELDFWGCVCNNWEFGIKKKWITQKQGLTITSEYIEMYGHIQDVDFKNKLDAIYESCRNREVDFKFMSEMIK